MSDTNQYDRYLMQKYPVDYSIKDNRVTVSVRSESSPYPISVTVIIQKDETEENAKTRALEHLVRNLLERLGSQFLT
jgi:hypothetical protein